MKVMNTHTLEKVVKIADNVSGLHVIAEMSLARNLADFYETKRVY